MESRTTTKLRALLNSGRIAVAPGAFDGLSARLVEQAGFPAIYASGGAIARSAGVPDLGLLSMSTIVDRLASMVDVVEVPLIADADTGYGNALNAQAAARAFERAGVAALHLEDQTFPKKCGHYDDKSLVPVGEMVQKLKAMRDALHDPDFVVIARTDAIAVESFAAAIDRASAYRRSRRRHDLCRGADLGAGNRRDRQAPAGVEAHQHVRGRQDAAFAGGAARNARLPRRHHSERYPACRHQGHAAGACRAGP